MSSEVINSVRHDDGVELVVKTPDGVKLICAKKLLITIPPKLDLLASFDLQEQERDVFARFINAGYYSALIKNTGVPEDLFIYNYAPDMPYNLPAIPGIYLMQPTAIPGVKAIYYGADVSNATYPLSDEMNALQGLKSTYWSGAAFRAHDSSALWQFNKEVVLPMLTKGL